MTLFAKKNANSYKNLYDFQRKDTKTGLNLQEFIPQNTVILGF